MVGVSSKGIVMVILRFVKTDQVVPKYKCEGQTNESAGAPLCIKIYILEIFPFQKVKREAT